MIFHKQRAKQQIRIPLCFEISLLREQRPNTHLLGLIKPPCPYPRLHFMCFVADFQVRLNGSSLSFAGTINVLYYGIWGGILGFYVDIRVGHVVCRQLGYSRAERIFSYASFGRVIGPLLIWRIQCNGNETEISQCKVETWNTSLHGSYHQRPRNAASLLCSKENSSLSKGTSGGQYLRKRPSAQPSNCPFKRGSKNNFIPRPKK